MRDVHDARQRAALLAGDDVLTTQYKEMVDGGVVTEEVGERAVSTLLRFPSYCCCCSALACFYTRYGLSTSSNGETENRN